MASIRHIGIIMDGNGRWATDKKLSRDLGHKEGVNSLVNVVKQAVAINLDCMSIYAFSTENWSRPKNEIDKLFKLLRDYFDKNYKALNNQNVKIITMGDLSELPIDLCTSINRAVESTSDNTGLILNIGLNYGARTELVRAVNIAIADGLTNISAQDIEDRLYTKALPPLDLIIRTSGEQRLSNFMLWQACYSEMYFVSAHWPDFGAADLDAAIEWYNTRKRRFGKVD